jgi:hypothetical protein
MPFDAMPDAEVTGRDRMIRLRDFLSRLPPQDFDMHWWEARSEESTCGTTACIGGWAKRMYSLETTYDVGPCLALEPLQAEALFYPGQALMSDGRPAFDAKPADAVRVLDHYLATGEIDWSVA